MRVYLVQHGDAAAKDVGPERRLTEKGVLDVTRLAAFLKPVGINCVKIQHSGKARAEQTAELLAASLGGADRLSGKDGIAPLDDVEPVRAELDSSGEDLALVGHMPFMGKLVSRLLAQDESLLVAAFKPGSIVCLEKDNEGNWHMAWMIRPELL